MKPQRKEPEHSRERGFTVVLEDIQSQFRVFGEGMQNVDRHLDRIENRLENVETDVSIIKIEMASMRNEMSFVRKVLPEVATKDDLHQLEKRLTALEHSR